MSLKGLGTSSCAIIICLFTACTASQMGQERMQNHPGEAQQLSGQFTIAQQVSPPDNIQSIALYPQRNRTALPVIELGKNEPLVLEFDALNTGSRQFELSVSHREKNWKKSPLGPSSYLGSFFETYFSGGQQSFTHNPSYRHYEYQFPNERLTITKSGNYLLSVHDNDSHELLFQLPFFVSEEKGHVQSRVETLFAQRNDARQLAQPFSRYQYPSFVKQPQFDLSFYYIQNQFLGRARNVTFFDTATQGEVHFHAGRDQAFIADYEFNLLELNSLQPDGRQIIDYQPGKNPPIVTLRRNVQLFDAKANLRSGSMFGLPESNQHAQYVDVEFSLETAHPLSANEQLYLVGDFNYWMIAPQYRMHFDAESSLWKGRALIKQGQYRYKYVMLQEGEIKDLALDKSFTNTRQQYATFIYYKDPQQHYDRLLKVNEIQAK